MPPFWLLVGGFLFMVVSGYIDWMWSVLAILGAVIALIYALYHHQDKLLYQPLVYPQFAIPAQVRCGSRVACCALLPDCTELSAVPVFVMLPQNPEKHRHPLEHGMTYDNLYLDTPDGVKLHVCARMLMTRNSACAAHEQSSEFAPHM